MDKQYGLGIRVQNAMKNGGYRCTCGAEHMPKVGAK